jgi:hypothetical protein
MRDVLSLHVEVGLIQLDRAGENRLRIAGDGRWVAIAAEDRKSYWVGRIRMLCGPSSQLLVRQLISTAVRPGTGVSSDRSVPEVDLEIEDFRRSPSLWDEARREADRLRRADYLPWDEPGEIKPGEPTALSVPAGRSAPAAWATLPDGPTQRVCRIFRAWWQRRHRSKAQASDLDGELAEFSFLFNRRRWQNERVATDLLTWTLAANRQPSF